MAGQSWDASYRDGPAPWEIGRPQPAVVRLAADGSFAGSVLDAGCGSGDNAVHIASLGLPVFGVDVAETALGTARTKAQRCDCQVEFAASDALRLDRLGRTFDTVLDCGLFHALDDDERSAYVTGLASVTKVRGVVYVLCFSDQGPGTGPHPVSRDELTGAFTHARGWRVVSVDQDWIHTRFHGKNGAPAWRATIQRIE